jgi:hypothetical protein
MQVRLQKPIVFLFSYIRPGLSDSILAITNSALLPTVEFAFEITDLTDASFPKTICQGSEAMVDIARVGEKAIGAIGGGGIYLLNR